MKSVNHNTLVPVGTLTTPNQCIKYKGQNALFKEHCIDKSYIYLCDEKWQKIEGIFIDNGTIIDNCTAPLFL